MTVGQNIRTFRTKQGLTQAKLSELTGIAEVTIRKYESGKIVPKSQNLNRLAKGLGVSASDLDEGLSEMLQQWDSQIDTASLYESGKIVPKSQNLNRLAKGLGVSASDLDEGLSEMLQQWDSQIDTASLCKEVHVWESIEEQFGENAKDFLNDFLSLNSEGQQKASEYIDLLMLKYKDK